MRHKVMELAHKLAKAYEGDYVARLALALKEAWKVIKKKEAIASSIQIKKCKEWQKYGKHRFYFDADVKAVYHSVTGYTEQHFSVTGFYDLQKKNFFIIPQYKRSWAYEATKYAEPAIKKQVLARIA